MGPTKLERYGPEILDVVIAAAGDAATGHGEAPG
jgi:hypothetical protein